MSKNSPYSAPAEERPQEEEISILTDETEMYGPSSDATPTTSDMSKL